MTDTTTSDAPRLGERFKFSPAADRTWRVTEVRVVTLVEAVDDRDGATIDFWLEDETPGVWLDRP